MARSRGLGPVGRLLVLEVFWGFLAFCLGFGRFFLGFFSEFCRVF